ncbi:protein HIRA [Elysia marginata]|uniref:Protein HIRA n=1 Tax=Elysia marginata TaxID=1093978 RepID=A0AAV4IDH4_9GAST|nr:protein HIRA [Elysia marginata]
MSKRKHSAYMIEFKFQILSEVEEKKLTKTEICKKHSITNSTLSTILKDIEKLQKACDDSPTGYKENKTLQSRRTRGCSVCLVSPSDGKPIFSLDIHPDGSRVVTGGQGDDYGKIVIWNMGPVRDEVLEADEKVPKILCQMDNHYACVNCVRWSHNGKFLASGGDDKLVMIWQTSRGAGPSKAFGSSGSVVIYEQWRPVFTLRGHTGDVLDLSWSPQDVWLATCSVDNTITIWNALQFPEQVAVLKGHTGLVKGVTWDPLGKYLASQSDDRTLRVWRTMDWQQEVVISKPFQECGGTTHTLRLNWSPDGHHIVSAHAMNNSGPTAQIIQRESFNASLDFVGHRKAVTVVRFNPNILKKQVKGTKTQNCSCCAIGSKDRSLSIWLTALKRPLVVMHDLFENSILDVSWSRSGLELMSCSIDGTVAFMDFTTEEIGQALSKEEEMNMLESVYGKSVSLHDAATKKSQIIESAAMLNLQQQQQRQQQQQQKNGSNSLLTPNKNSNISSASFLSASGDNTPFKPTDKQIETRTADGRRRITPIFLAPQPEVGEVPLPFNSNSNIEFHSSSEKSKIVVEKQNRVTVPGMLSPNSGSKSMSSMPSPPPQGNLSLAGQPTAVNAAAAKDNLSLHSLKDAQAQKAVNEKTPEKEPMQTEPPPRQLSPIATPDISKTPTNTSIEKISSEKSKSGGKEKDKEEFTPTGKDKDKLKSRLTPGKLSLKRYRYAKRGRPSKSDQAAREAAMAAAAAEVVSSMTRADLAPIPATSSAAAAATLPGEAGHALLSRVPNDKSRVSFSVPDLQLPEMGIGKSTSKEIESSADGNKENNLVLEGENNIELGLFKAHKLRCLRGSRCLWEHFLTSKLCAVAGSRYVAACACADGTVNVLTPGGRRLLPALVVGAPPAFFTCSGHFLLIVTTRGQLYVWNFQTLKVEIKNESLSAFLSGKDNIKDVVLTPQGVPIVCLANRRSYSFSTDIGCWVVACGGDDGLQVNSNHLQSVPSKSRPMGPLSSLQKHFRLKGQVSRASQSSAGVQHTATLSHLESQVASSLALRSASEFKFWLETYVRYLAREGVEDKLREVCDDLLGPLYKSRKAKLWSQHVLGIDKHSVLRAVLPLIGAHLSLQRLYTEYNEQLEMVSSNSST